MVISLRRDQVAPGPRLGAAKRTRSVQEIDSQSVVDLRMFKRGRIRLLLIGVI